MNLETIESKALQEFDLEQYKIIPAIKENKCQRCFGIDMGVINNKKYCRQCINFGRIDERSKLIIFENLKTISKTSSLLVWDGKLTKLQKQVSDELKENFQKYQEHLLWAVTGAGKTEILFDTLDSAFQNGMRVALVSPRIDVCEELFPRFKKAFDLDIILMHGKKNDELRWTPFVIATVHQLLKFRNAFDLIIIDEVDSYPLFGNSWLEDIIFRALKRKSSIIYLSATPPKPILKRVDKIYYLPQRFHGKPLPVPIPKMLSSKKKLPNLLLLHIKRLIESNQRFLLFFPSIKALQRFGTVIKKYDLNIKYELVSSEQENRLEIVDKFRNDELFALFTTTILERGVTFRNVDVIVSQADDHNFSKEVLIQIAGRAGRQREHYDNKVTFYYTEYRRQIKTAIKEIKKLNELAEKLK